MDVKDASIEALLGEVERRIAGLADVPTSLLTAELTRRGSERLYGVQAMADEIGVDPATVKRWIKLPVNPLHVTQSGTKFSITKAGLRSWYATHELRLRSESGRRGRKTREERPGVSKIRAEP